MSNTDTATKTPQTKIRALRKRINQLDDMRTLQYKMYGDFPECEIFKQMAADLAEIDKELQREWKQIVW